MIEWMDERPFHFFTPQLYQAMKTVVNSASIAFRLRLAGKSPEKPLLSNRAQVRISIDLLPQINSTVAHFLCRGIPK